MARKVLLKVPHNIENAITNAQRIATDYEQEHNISPEERLEFYSFYNPYNDTQGRNKVFRKSPFTVADYKKRITRHVTSKGVKDTYAVFLLPEKRDPTIGTLLKSLNYQGEIYSCDSSNPETRELVQKDRLDGNFHDLETAIKSFYQS